ncbi:oxidoreductase [Leptolyngbya sp. FACHB-261]|uniref:oxidoreductase n=1 Tax=Leptolyngbya sp. FACHB-261 TaxID=2692806 RepID=UPI001683E458|nr:oxidoreductase [Leptolyngbya sp. FACHB-261]MBD2100994.1 SDR family NAD(P)-dependent oxidoreductase [Leptolyngbya sp. FACHB-261]
MASNNTKVWLITGSSSGFGRSLTEAVLEKGDRVIATARKPEQLDDLAQQYPDTAKAIRLDVTDRQEVESAIHTAINTFGRIDVLVNNAGYGLLGSIEEASEAEARTQFETNLFGALWMIQAVLPVMREQSSGHILNISSVGGFTGYAGFGIYNGTKFALEGISEALALEVAPFNIRITIVEPGSFRTDWAGRSMVRSERVIDAYAKSSGQTRDWMDQEGGNQAGDPALAAAAMMKVVNVENPPQRLVLGADALERIRGKLRSVAQELDAWEQTTVNTAFSTQMTH